MLGAAARLLPATQNSPRQIVPPVVATLLAAVLIAGYNRAFTGHLVQPRMGMLHGDVVGTDEAPRPAGVAPGTARAGPEGSGRRDTPGGGGRPPPGRAGGRRAGPPPPPPRPPAPRQKRPS